MGLVVISAPKGERSEVESTIPMYKRKNGVRA